MPPITQVWYTTGTAKRLTLEQECLPLRFLPPLPMATKVFPQAQGVPPGEVLPARPPLPEGVGGGGRVVKFIGYDAGEPERRERVRERGEADRKYQKEYPLWSGAGTGTGVSRPSKRAGLPAGEVLPAFLPQHKTAGDPHPLPRISGAIRPCPGHGGTGHGLH